MPAVGRLKNVGGRESLREKSKIVVIICSDVACPREYVVQKDQTSPTKTTKKKKPNKQKKNHSNKVNHLGREEHISLGIFSPSSMARTAWRALTS